MSRLNPAQYVIFSVTFLAASLVANFVLFQASASRDDQLDRANQSVTRLTQALSSDTSTRSDQSARLENMAAQQQDMAQIVDDLQGHIANLNKEYQQTLGYYTSLSNALEAIARDEAMSVSYDTIQEFINTYNQIMNRLSKVIKI